MPLHTLLKSSIPEDKLRQLHKGYEVVGKIAIVNVPAILEDYKYDIAEAVASFHDTTTVLRKLDKIKGELRVADFEVLFGDGVDTIHKENGCAYCVDVTRAYFSTRQYSARMRIAECARDGEDILCLFAGVGPYVIPVAKRHAVRIVAVEINNVACRHLMKNTKLNRVSDSVDVVCADAVAVGSMLRAQFDRIIMPTPYGCDFFLDTVLSILKPGGMVHFITFKGHGEVDEFASGLVDKGVEVQYMKRVGNVAPGVGRYVLDLVKIG